MFSFKKQKKQQDVGYGVTAPLSVMPYNIDNKKNNQTTPNKIENKDLSNQTKNKQSNKK